MSDVAARLDLAFADVSGGLIHRCIDHTKKKVREMNAYLVELEATDEAANEPPLPVDEESSDDDESDDDESILTDIVDVNLA
ncbi:hypothetical protein H310_12391 [Aphanomyces invadans]|uniref:Uncharacterized protein n=1 Tax=Aphanomyces invadans TaxID=157072 RepID=A0A024TJR9_9STRA|nr:hypothetical protein H310_12391 [Aphanomyces invadans]ETV93597.1 hypothetical protein H310_12391 [Aphanomyces invadans]|eukprot:XP_008877638.1 hypothetical protein H310_12391 [Aphanomyces invadans]